MPSIEEQFEKWHADNPHVYSLFKDFARQVRSAGHDHYSADAILSPHQMAHERGDQSGL